MRNKKRDPLKALRKLTPDIIANTCIYQLPYRKCEFVHMKDRAMYKDAMVNVYTKMRHNWTVALLVLRFDEQGRDKLEVQHVQPTDKCKADDIADAIESTHDKMIEKFPDMLCGAWLAIPRDEFLSSVVIHKILSDAKAWEQYR